MRGLCILSLIAGITSCLLSIHLPKFAYKNNNLNLVGKNFRKLFLNKKFLLCSFLAFVQQGIQGASHHLFWRGAQREKRS